MANELQELKANTFNYDFKPAEIEIKGYDNLVEIAEQVAHHYDNLVLKDAELSQINEEHKNLNSFIRGLDESRKEVKREYNKPLNEFEGQIKDVIGLLQPPLQKIKDVRDEILTAQEQARTDALNDHIEQRLRDTGLQLEDIEIAPSWTNKGNWTDKLNPRKPLKDEIEREVNRAKEELKNKIANRKVLETFCEQQGIDPDGWTSQLEYREATEIIEEIQAAEERKRQAKKDKEEQEALNQEQQKTIEEIEQEVHREIERDFEEESQELITNTIQVTGTVEQLNNLNEFLINSGIQVEQIFNEDSLAIDDLPL